MLSWACHLPFNLFIRRQPHIQAAHLQARTRRVAGTWVLLSRSHFLSSTTTPIIPNATSRCDEQPRKWTNDHLAALASAPKAGCRGSWGGPRAPARHSPPAGPSRAGVPPASAARCKHGRGHSYSPQPTIDLPLRQRLIHLDALLGTHHRHRLLLLLIALADRRQHEQAHLGRRLGAPALHRGLPWLLAAR